MLVLFSSVDSNIFVIVVMPYLDLNFHLGLRIIFLDIVGPFLYSSKRMSVFCKWTVFMEVSIHLVCTDKPTLFHIEAGKYIMILCTTDVFQKTLRCAFGEKNRVFVIFVLLYVGVLDM